MSIKRKLLIALLTASCITAGAFGLAACQPDTPPEPGPGPVDPVIDNTVDNEAFEIALANGVEAADKDAWLEDLKVEHGKTDADIKKVSASADGDIVITYTDNTSKTIAMAVKLYKVLCVDSASHSPVADVWFRLGYMDGSNFVLTDTAADNYAKSGADGYAVFRVTPDAATDYVVRLADPTDLQNKGLGNLAYPESYSPSFGTVNGFPVVNLAFENTRNITANFRNTANDFYTAPKTQIPYTRTAAGETNGTAAGAFSLDAKANTYTYLYFCPFVDPDVDANNPSFDTIRENARRAASGKYRFTVTASSGTAALLLFNGTRNHTQTNDDNIPAQVIYSTGGTAGGVYDNGSIPDGEYTGDNTITINKTRDVANADNLFGVTASEDCRVTIAVERIGDAEEAAEVEVTRIPAPANVEQYAEKAEGDTLTLVPVAGTVNIMRGDDGFYHLFSAGGPILLVNLNQPLQRVAPVAISELPDQVVPGGGGEPSGEAPPTMGEAALTFSVSNGNGTVIARHNYYDVVMAYSGKANSDGVYGVDDLLFNFLQAYGATSSAAGASPNNPYNWLLPCQYYQPEGGVPVTGEGTQSSPYQLLSGDNSFSINGSTAYLSFSASETGVYRFRPSEGTSLYCTSSLLSSIRDENGYVYVCVTSVNVSVTFLISGDGAASVNVVRQDIDVAAEYNDDQQTTTGTENNPRNLAPGRYNVNITSANDEGVWVNFGNRYALDNAETEYVFELYGDNAAIVYNGTTYTGNRLRLTLTGRETVKLLLTTRGRNDEVVYGNYMLYAHPYDGSAVETNGLELGNNFITFADEDEAQNGKEYTFLSEAGGAFTITLTSGNGAWVGPDRTGENNYIDAQGGNRSYGFVLEAGQSVTFYIGGWANSSILLTITPGADFDDHIIVLGEQKTVNVPTGENGYIADMDITAEGEYSVRIELVGQITDYPEITFWYRPDYSFNMPATDVAMERNGNVYTCVMTVTAEGAATGSVEISIETSANVTVSATVIISLNS